MTSAGSVFNKFLTLTLPPFPFGPKTHRAILAAGLIALGLAIAWLPVQVTGLLLGGIVFLILLLRRPILSLYLLIPLIPFSSFLGTSLGGVRVGLMEIVLAAGLVTWLLQLSTHHNYRFDSPPLLWPFLIFLGMVSLSWLNTLSIGASLVETIKWVEMLALYIFIIALLPARHIKWVVVAILLTGLVQALLGLYQFIFKVGPEGFLLLGGRFLRAYGTFAQPNPYAGYLGLILPLALSVTIWSFINLWQSKSHKTMLCGRVKLSSLPNPARIRANHFFILALAGLSLTILLAALLASLSRAAWLSFGVAALVTLLAYSKKPALLMAGLVFVGSVVFLTSSFDLSLFPTGTTYGAVIQRFAEALAIVNITDISSLEVTDANFATIERLAHWQAAREMWRDNLWLGAGFGNYAVMYPAYAVGRWLDPLGHAHNYLLNLGAETGLVGIMGYLIFWIWAFGVIWVAVRHNHGFYRAVAAGGLGILVHLHLHNLFDNLYVQGMYLHLAIILALTSIIFVRKEKEFHP